MLNNLIRLYSFIHSFIHDIFIAPLQVHYYSEVLPTQHRYCAGISHRSATACDRQLRVEDLPKVPTWGTHDPSDERRRLYQSATPTPVSNNNKILWRKQIQER